MARPAQRLVRSPSTRRQTAWELSPFLTSTSLTAEGQTVSTGVSILADGLTLIRIRGILALTCTSVSAVTSHMVGSIGFAVATENAFGVGVSALPNPSDDPEWDGWIYHHYFDVGYIAAQGSGAVRLEIDSKSMRKIPESNVLYATIDIQDEIGTVAVTAALETRSLYKLP